MNGLQRSVSTDPATENVRPIIVAVLRGYMHFIFVEPDAFRRASTGRTSNNLGSIGQRLVEGRFRLNRFFVEFVPISILPTSKPVIKARTRTFRQFGEATCVLRKIRRGSSGVLAFGISYDRKGSA